MLSGAFGESELAIVEQLLGEFHASVALVGCTHRLPSGGWQAIQSNATMPDFIRKRVEKLLDTQSSSGRILVVDAELTRPEEMKRGMRLVLDTFGRIDGLVYVTDEINENLRTTNSSGNVETSLVQAIEKTQTVSGIYGGQQADFRLFCSFQNLQAAPQSAINRAAMSEFLSSLSAMRTGLPVVCLARRNDGTESR